MLTDSWCTAEQGSALLLQGLKEEEEEQILFDGNVYMEMYLEWRCGLQSTQQQDMGDQTMSEVPVW